MSHSRWYIRRDQREVFPGLDSGPNCSEGHYSIPWKNVPLVPPYIPPGGKVGGARGGKIRGGRGGKGGEG